MPPPRLGRQFAVLGAILLGLAVLLRRDEQEPATASSSQVVRMSNHTALACLRLTTPSVRLRYPDDAEAHFREVRRALDPWAPCTVRRYFSPPVYCGVPSTLPCMSRSAKCALHTRSARGGSSHVGHISYCPARSSALQSRQRKHALW